MLNIRKHQRNTSQDHNEIPLHIPQDDCYFFIYIRENKKRPKAADDIELLGPYAVWMGM